MRDENCIFCKIANGEIPSSTVYEDEEFRAILDDLGLEGEYEGIGHCAIGYPDIRLNRGAARKDDRVFWVE